ncbi:MAG: hypothetical protein ISR87_03465 [Candidatus Marinimicrobia bacterium]|nr:hypothetical protein [FCB group bacterium]MBL7024489.1 hypothetical protein [Candidatus Neomarinimicrobiota bacterium]
MISRKMILCGLVILIVLSSLNAQVAISPTSAFLDSKQRFETVLILNNSDDPQEVKLEFKFAYPKANEEGNIELVYDDVKETELHSATSWLRGFPKNFILGPGQRQVVRITAKPPRDLEPGMYWSRLITTSSAVSPEIGEEGKTGISAQITMQFSQITSIFFSTGELSTGIEFTGVRPIVKDEVLRVLVDYTKSGNAPYLGTMHAKIFNSSGTQVLEKKMFVSIYYDGLRLLKADATDLPAGNYDVEVTATSGRSDIPGNDVVKAQPQTIRGSFTKS